jgi:hypothetical protein
MKGQAAGDQIKRSVVKGNASASAGGFEELVRPRWAANSAVLASISRRQIGGDNMGHVGSEGQSGVARAGRHIYGLPMGLRLDQFEQNSQALSPGVNITGGVGVTRRAELGLNFSFYFIRHQYYLLGHLRLF